MSDPLTETRLITETGLEAKIAQIVEPIVEQIGYRLVRVRLSARNGQTLQIMAERPDGTMRVDDCEKLSHALSPVLDIEDPIDRAYHLEVSSPGIDRPLVRLNDFARWFGHSAKFEMRTLFEGRRRFKGTILGAENGRVLIQLDDESADNNRIALPIAELMDARLILSDSLIREALKRDKALRQANEDMHMQSADGGS